MASRDARQTSGPHYRFLGQQRAGEAVILIHRPFGLPESRRGVVSFANRLSLAVRKQSKLHPSQATGRQAGEMGIVLPIRADIPGTAAAVTGSERIMMLF